MDYQLINKSKPAANATAGALKEKEQQAGQKEMTSRDDSFVKGLTGNNNNIHPVASQPAQKKAGEKEGNLPDELQMKMEDAFETDFSTVKVYENSKAAADLGALAFTQGDEIHFRSDTTPYSQKGQQILGHELSHVVQQRNGEVAATHYENGMAVNADRNLEQKADIEGRKAVNGEKVGNSSKATDSKTATTQKKSGTIQMWQDVPGQIRTESTATDAAGAWTAVSSCIGQVVGGFAGSVMDEMRAALYPLIVNHLSGSFAPISINNLKTYGGVNFTWHGDITFKIDNIREITGGGTGTTTLGGGGTTTTGSSTTDAQTGGTTGGGTVSSSPSGATGGTGGSVTAGVSSTGTNTQGTSDGTASNSTSTSVINQGLKRYSALVACFVHLGADSSFGDSGWDYVNPVAWVSGAGGGIGTWLNGSADASSNCGSFIFYAGDGIVPPGK